MVVAVDRLPGAKVSREILPGPAGSCHPEDAGHDGAWLQRDLRAGATEARDEIDDLVPAGIIEVGHRRAQVAYDGRTGDDRLLGASARIMTALRDRLMVPAKDRPPQVDVEISGVSACRQEQPLNLGDGERD